MAQRESASHQPSPVQRPWRTRSVTQPDSASSVFRSGRKLWPRRSGTSRQRRPIETATGVCIMSVSMLSAAYGGELWSPRVATMTEDMASTWGDWGVSSEIGKLHAVLLRRPGSELDAVVDFDAMQMRSDLLPDRVREQHDALADAYRAAGVMVHYVERGRIDKPNAMFVRDLMLMTPEGAIVTRPASTVRAGEERLVAEALAQLGVPILMSVHGSGTFEGADVIWVDEKLCFSCRRAADQRGRGRPGRAHATRNRCGGGRASRTPTRRDASGWAARHHRSRSGGHLATADAIQGCQHTAQ